VQEVDIPPRQQSVAEGQLRARKVLRVVEPPNEPSAPGRCETARKTSTVPTTAAENGCLQSGAPLRAGEVAERCATTARRTPRLARRRATTGTTRRPHVCRRVIATLVVAETAAIPITTKIGPEAVTSETAGAEVAVRRVGPRHRSTRQLRQAERNRDNVAMYAAPRRTRDTERHRVRRPRCLGLERDRDRGNTAEARPKTSVSIAPRTPARLGQERHRQDRRTRTGFTQRTDPEQQRERTDRKGRKGDGDEVEGVEIAREVEVDKGWRADDRGTDRQCRWAKSHRSRRSPAPRIANTTPRSSRTAGRPARNPREGILTELRRRDISRRAHFAPARNRGDRVRSSSCSGSCGAMLAVAAPQARAARASTSPPRCLKLQREEVLASVGRSISPAHEPSAQSALPDAERARNPTAATITPDRPRCGLAARRLVLLLDGDSSANPVQLGPAQTDYYNLLTDGFAAGHLNTDRAHSRATRACRSV